MNVSQRKTHTYFRQQYHQPNVYGCADWLDALQKLLRKIQKKRGKKERKKKRNKNHALDAIRFLQST